MLSVVALQRFKVGLVVKCFFHKIIIENVRSHYKILIFVSFCYLFLHALTGVLRSPQPLSGLSTPLQRTILASLVVFKGLLPNG